MKKYLSIFRIRFIYSIQYRIVVFSHLFTGFLWGMMVILAYIAFYRADSSAFPMTLSETISYMWLQESLLILFSVVLTDAEIESSIVNGYIAYELVRPADLYARWFSRASASRAAPTLYRLPLLAAVLFLPKPYRLSLPPDLFQFSAFLLSAVLALFVTVSFTMLMYAAMFYTTSFGGIRVIVIAATRFFTGSVIPFPFFPAPVQAVLEALPFAAMQNMPLRIYSGNISGIHVPEGILFQIVWLILLIAAGKGFMHHALQKVIVQGG